MELFLNLCWLSLLPPAYLLWRRRAASTSSGVPAGSPAAHPLVFLCALGCVFVLLFPVISITDDLHPMQAEMEEAKRAFQHPGHCACTIHALTQFAQLVLPASLTPATEQSGAVLPFIPQTIGAFSASSAPAGRAPPSGHPTSL
ncbi:MAG: hypothetical protein ABSD64_06870 [Terriglobales bacterium]|jgi:hypothetical protein